MVYAIFDLDGTLVDLFDLHLKGFQEVVAEDYGLEFKREDLQKHYGRTAEEIAATFFEEHGVEDVDLDEFVRRRRQYVIEEIRSCELLPGAEELLESLRQAQVGMALATSNTEETGEAIVDACRIKKYFSVRVYRDRDLKSKPAPDIFVEAARRLETDPRECIVFEDSVHGVRAAKAAHMTVVAVSTGTHSRNELEDENPEMVLSSLKEADLSKLLHRRA